MEDYYQHKKAYCREGESDPQVALAVAMVSSVAILLVAAVAVWFVFFL